MENIVSINISNKDKIFFLNKIKHKPVILESIFSFSKNRPYILLDMISTDKKLKIAMKKVFTNSKVNNDLSKELNINIKEYIRYRESSEKIKDECKNIFSDNDKNIYKVIEKPNLEDEFSFIKNEGNFNKKILKKDLTNLKKHYPALYEALNKFGSELPLKLLLKCLKDEGELELYMEAKVLLSDEEFDESFIKNFDFHKFPKFTKVCGDLCKKFVEKQILDECFKENKDYKELSNIKKILSIFQKSKLNKNIKSLTFDYLSGLDKFILYNLPYDNNFDKEYLNYITNHNNNQNIKLICIIDRFNNNQYIDIIEYPYITSLNFVLCPKEIFNNKFMFCHLPIKNIYNIFVNYFVTIRNYENIQEISFSDEFFVNKNQFVFYNDEYYQSFISYIIDQYFHNFSNNKDKDEILSKIFLNNIILKEDKLDNYYERFKILYGFNKMFPKLKTKKLLRIDYKDIINNSDLYNNNHYKIMIIDFYDEEINDIYKMKENIYLYLSNNIDAFKNINIISFYNLNLNNINIDQLIDNKIFNYLPNLNEFFINNNKYKITSNNKIQNQNNKFIYLYSGYDSDNNLIYFRNGINQIKPTDILDLFNIFNKNISKFCLLYEKITIIRDKNNNELKIINDLTNNKENIYYIPLKKFSDFIQNYNEFQILKIEGFDFTFGDIKNKNIKKLYLNYVKNEGNSNLYEYKYDLNDIKDKKSIDEDMNLNLLFPELEELYIGNISSNEKIFYQKLINSNDSKIQFNILSFENLQKLKKNVNIEIIKNENEEKEEYEEEENNEDDYEYEDEINNLIYDKYEDEDNIVVNDLKAKNKKFKKKKEEEQNNPILYRESISCPYYWGLEEEEELQKLKDLLRIKSKIIVNYKAYYAVLKALLRAFPHWSAKKIKSKLILNNNHDFTLPQNFNNMNNILCIFNMNFNIFCTFVKKGGLKPNTCLNNFLLLLNSYEQKLIYLKEEDKKEVKNLHRADDLLEYMSENNNSKAIKNYKDLFEHFSPLNSEFLDNIFRINLNDKNQCYGMEIFQLYVD